jgi:hypothetical protein
VRSVYLYVMCAVSVALVGFGAVSFAVGLVHTVAPDLGHRDTLDRVGIGLSNVGGEIVDLFNESQLEDIEDYCRDVTDTDGGFEDCIADETEFQAGGEDVDAIQEGIAEVRDELRSQIRNNSIDRMIRGLLGIAAGVILFRIHGRRTALFADGLMPRTPPPEPTEPAAPVTLEAPASTFAPPPPPPAAE